MICYNFGDEYQKIHNGIFWMDQTGDYPLYHTHNYWEFVICKKGPFEHNINGKTKSFETGDAILVGPQDCHSLKSSSKNVIHLDIGVSDEVFRKICDVLSPDFYEYIKSNHLSNVKFSLEKLSKIESYFKSILISTDEKDTQVIVSFIIFNLLEPIYAFFKSENSEMPEWFKELLVQCNSFEHLNWKPHDVCDYVNYSQAHINRVFRKTLNTTLVDYLIDIKMNNAIVLLTNTDMSLTNIVYTLGYNSISYFSHTFKKYYHVSPYKYKTMYKAQNSTK